MCVPGHVMCHACVCKCVPVPNEDAAVVRARHLARRFRSVNGRQITSPVIAQQCCACGDSHARGRCPLLPDRSGKLPWSSRVGHVERARALSQVRVRK
eukprot:15007505-Alexandrium_andersonii.AAC.1